MNLPSKYWILNQIGLGKCQAQEVKEAKEFFMQKILELAEGETVTDTEIIRQLWGLYQSATPYPLVEVCLRCVISHHIREFCYQLAEQFGGKHHFIVEDLLPLVLDSTHNSFNHGNHDSLTTRILQSFDPEKSSLSSWTKRIVKSDKEFKKFLLLHGIELVTDWLLLKQTNARQLQQILSDFHGHSHSRIQQLINLLESYQMVYLAEIHDFRHQINQERRKQGLGKLKTPYPAPNHQQLEQMAEKLFPTWKLLPEEVLEELQNLAKLIREYKSCARVGAAQVFGKPVTKLSNHKSDEDEEESELLNTYRRLLQDALTTAIKEVTEERVKYLQSKRNKRDKQFLQALHLFHCQNLPMGEIANLVGLNNQSQVSRLLELKTFRSDIARRTLVKLRSKVVKLAQAYASPAQIRDLEAKISDFLNEEIDVVMQEAEKEVSISKNRILTSKLSLTICHYIDERKEVK